MRQTAFVIDDDDDVARSLTFLLRADGVASRSFGSARLFLDQLRPDHRGCIITDVRMPVMDGVALVDALGEIGCLMPVIVVTGYASVPLAVQVMKSGVIDFIEKPFESATILKAVRSAFDVPRAREDREASRSALLKRQNSLTGRECQVMRLVADGLSNKIIADKLGISYRTVEIYRARVMATMQADSLPDLVRMVLATEAA